MIKLKLQSAEKLLFTIAQQYYESRQTKTAIAKKLGVSVTHIARLLREALATGIVEIHVKSPRSMDLESKLCSLFGLREVRVIIGGADEAGVRSHLGTEAAALFDQLARTGSKVGIGSGRTMYELVKAIPERQASLELFPMALLADQSTDVRSVDASTLVTTLWFKLRPEARALKVGFSFPEVPFADLASSVRASLSPRFLGDFLARISAGDVYFFSCSQVREDSQILDLARQRKLGFAQLHERGIVGDYLFRSIDSQGSPVDIGLDEYIIGADPKLLEKISADKNKMVVLVAGGREKAPVIAAGARARLFNVLVTDDVAAELLLERQLSSKSHRRVLGVEQVRQEGTHGDTRLRGSGVMSSVRSSIQRGDISI